MEQSIEDARGPSVRCMSGGTTVTGRLAGRVAMVTGAGSGIGRAVGQALLSAGAHVVAVDLPTGGADDEARLAKEIGEGAIGVRADVTDRAAVEAAVAVATDTWGAL